MLPDRYLGEWYSTAEANHPSYEEQKAAAVHNCWTVSLIYGVIAAPVRHRHLLPQLPGEALLRGMLGSKTAVAERKLFHPSHPTGMWYSRMASQRAICTSVSVQEDIKDCKPVVNEL